MSEATLMHKAKDYYNELRDMGHERFLERHNHPFLITYLDSQEESPIMGTPTVRVSRPHESAGLQAAVSQDLAWYCIPLDPSRKKPVSVGRSGVCDVTSGLQSLSNFHAAIGLEMYMGNRSDELSRYADRRFQVRDMGSTNGTELNGVKLKTGTNYGLNPGDVLNLAGALKLKFVQGTHTIAFLNKYREMF